MITQEQIVTVAKDAIVSYGPKLLYALVVLVLGFWIIGIVKRTLNRRMKRSRSDPSLRHFLISLFTIGVKALVLITVASMLGIATTSFVAILGAAGLAVGLALQGSLANFAGGVLLLMFKPYKVQEYIKAQGYEGTVEKIEIFNTTLKTVDNKIIILPNGVVSNGPITNYSREKTRRVDLTFGISYDDDIRKAQKIILALVKKDKRILQDPEPFVRVGELGDNSVNFTVRLWAKTEDYWGVHFDMIESVKETFDKEGVSFPYPQMDVYLKK